MHPDPVRCPPDLFVRLRGAIPSFYPVGGPEGAATSLALVRGLHAGPLRAQSWAAVTSPAYWFTLPGSVCPRGTEPFCIVWRGTLPTATTSNCLFQTASATGGQPGGFGVRYNGNLLTVTEYDAAGGTTTLQGTYGVTSFNAWAYVHAPGSFCSLYQDGNLVASGAVRSWFNQNTISFFTSDVNPLVATSLPTITDFMIYHPTLDPGNIRRVLEMLLYQGASPAGDPLLAAITADLPVHYWRLDDSPGATTALDLGSSFQDMTYINVGSGTAQATVTSPALLFGGGFGMQTYQLSGFAGGVSSKYFGAAVTGRTNTAILMDTRSTKMTFECWHKTEIPTTVTSGFGFMLFSAVESNAASGTSKLVFGVASGGYRAKVNGVHGGLWEQLSCGTRVTSGGVWNHVAWVLNGSYELLYLNGTLQYSGARVLTPSSVQGYWTIGANSMNTGLGGINNRMGHTGMIRDVALWWRDIGSDRILAHYNAGIAQVPGGL